MHAVNSKLIALALGATLFSPVAFAQVASAKAATDAKASTTTKSPSAPGKGDWWKEADINGDGKLSSAEATANAGLSTRFSIIDVDKDGYLTSVEYRQYYANDASQGEVNAAGHSAVVSRDLWVKLDANGDGRISLTEATANADFTGLFTTIDIDSDGFVTQDEYTAHAKLQK